jgi:hypothetical protein
LIFGLPDVICLVVLRQVIEIPDRGHMGIAEQISEDLKGSMKARDELRVSCLRMLKTSVKHRLP